MHLNKITIVWLIIVALVGGVLGLTRMKQEEDTPFVEKVKRFAIGLATSMFTAYLTFELAYAYFGKENAAVAIAGLAAWMGADALITLEIFVKNYIKNRS